MRFICLQMYYWFNWELYDLFIDPRNNGILLTDKNYEKEDQKVPNSFKM